MTEQRNARLAALESERRFRLLVQGVIDYAIYMLNPDGYVTNWNVGAERTYKFTAAEIIGEHFARVFTAEDLAVGAPGKALEIAGREGHYEAEGWRCREALKFRESHRRQYGPCPGTEIFCGDIHASDLAKIVVDVRRRRQASADMN
jgi:PAS domain S-box-containing protein